MVNKSKADILKQIMATNLKHYIDRSGKNQTDIARELDIPEMTMSNWVKAKTYPRMDKIQLLADYFHIRRSDLTEEKSPNLFKAPSQTIQIPILDSISCTDPIYIEENFNGYKYESPEDLPSGNLLYLQNNNDSMEPTIPNGSLVLIRQQSEVEYGQIAAVLLTDSNETTLRRVRKQGNTLLLMPDNPKHEPIIIAKESRARIIGLAIRYTKDLITDNRKG
ncbi:LexA family protein [Ornithinibacillus sp. 4-3]|uniref:LexA family protein n=1 Tax=Ornithinibacillus sp. 4-3 TaxID=3231488 RepID=A0AB39HPH5_9BACI